MEYNLIVRYTIVFNQGCMEYQYNMVANKINVIEKPEKLQDIKYTMMLAQDIPTNHLPFCESISMQCQKGECPIQQPIQLSASPDPFL